MVGDRSIPHLLHPISGVRLPMMHTPNDTIAAIATARGRAALAIVRLSGPEAVEVASACFRGSDLSSAPSHTAHVGYITGADSVDIDQVVVTLFLAPRSVTGENVVEISCHGGDFAAQMILQRLLESGARMAEPGEFTQRAFVNGKMDLAQAEAVADLIHASSSMAHRVSLSHLQGRYSDVLASLREELLELAAFVELELDFSEEDVEFADRGRLERLLEESERLLRELRDSYRIGARLRDGVRVVIGGRPNAGKSTLLNALLGRDRAIVSATPGTTRDEIEAETEIGGVLYRFVDTAGLRETSDAIEAEGVKRAEKSIEQSDVLVYVYDMCTGLDPDERSFLELVRERQAGLPVLLVANKRDLANGTEIPDEALPLSAARGMAEEEEILPLVDRLRSTVSDSLSLSDASHVVTNQRHREHLRKALAAVQSAADALHSGGSGDTLALDLRMALHEIGAITGEITNEDVLDQIFSRFCIGK